MCLTLAILLLAAPAAPMQTNKTVWDGTYTSAQATRGQAAYTMNCSGCHGDDLAGRNAAKPLKGVEFMERWREYDLEPVFTIIKNYMPPRTERLSDNMYLDILSYILQVNGFPAGTDELRFETLEHILVVGKDGPKPVPDGSLVRVVGCLVKRSETNWMLIDATEPVREKVADKSNPEELKRSVALPVGSLRFRLVNFDYIAPDFRPDPYNGQRVQTKGYLIRQPNAERINLTSLERVATTCP